MNSRDSVPAPEMNNIKPLFVMKSSSVTHKIDCMYSVTHKLLRREILADNRTLTKSGGLPNNLLTLPVKLRSLPANLPTMPGLLPAMVDHLPAKLVGKVMRFVQRHSRGEKRQELHFHWELFQYQEQ